LVPSFEIFKDKITFGYGFLKNDKELLDWTWNNQQITSRSSAHKSTKGWPMCEYYYLLILCTWSRCNTLIPSNDFKPKIIRVYISYKMDGKDI